MPSSCTTSVRLVKRLLLFHIFNLLFATSQAASQPGPVPARPDQLISLEVSAETVKAVLLQIERQAGVHFQYSKELIGADRRVTVSAMNQPLAEVLKEILAPLHIRYEILDYGIILTPVAIDGTLYGRVLDDKGEPLPGVTVRVEGTLIGNYTDGDGKYKLLNVPAGPQFLIFSSVGYVTLRMPFSLEVGQSLSLDATLAEDVKQLEEVVVVGYGTARRQDVTGSVATVTSKDFVQGQVTDPTRLIQGKVAGVQIAAGGGAPGEFGVIRIRDGSSLSASNDPLIVIDGVPVDNNGINGAGNPLALINPNDIETFTVLKDASATAIYGSRASNGVLLITTKKGAAGEPMHVTLNSQVSRATNYGRVEVLTGDQYRRLTAQVDAAQFKEVPTNRSAYLGTANTDWQKEIYQTAYTTDNSVSVTGSAKKLPYRVSVGYLDQQGTLKTGYMKRATGSIGLSPRLFDGHLRIDVNVKGTSANYRFADQAAIGSAVLFDPTQPIYSGESRFNGYYEWLDPANNAPQQLTSRNPLAILNDKRDVSQVLRTIGNVQFDYQLHFLPDLHANLNLGYDISRSEVHRDIAAASSLAYLTQGLKQQEKQTRNTELLEFYLKYAKALGSHHVELLAGYSYQDFYRFSPSFFTYTAAGTPAGHHWHAAPAL